MAATKKFYPLSPEVLLNAIYDIQEMRKALVVGTPVEKAAVTEVEMITEMYRIKKAYLFRLTRGKAGTTVEIESDDGKDDIQQSVSFMLNTLDGMVVPHLPRMSGAASA